jgi:uncharacterized membrane protein YccC
MPIHWSHKGLPELSALSDVERKDVWKKAIGQAYERWQTWLASAIVFILVMPAGGWLGSRFENTFIGMMIGGVLASAITERIVFQTARSHLKKTIARTDED